MSNPLMHNTQMMDKMPMQSIVNTQPPSLYPSAPYQQPQPTVVAPTMVAPAMAAPAMGSSTVNPQQQVVVLNNRPQGPTNKFRPWKSGMCSCCDDIGSCCCGLFCMPCLACQVSSRLNENCMVPMCVPGGLMALRTKLRTEYDIVGSICGDCLMMCFCGALGVCQMSRELDGVGM